jgi:hypothetical protein
MAKSKSGTPSGLLMVKGCGRIIKSRGLRNVPNVAGTRNMSNNELPRPPQGSDCKNQKTEISDALRIASLCFGFVLLPFWIGSVLPTAESMVEKFAGTSVGESLLSWFLKSHELSPFVFGVFILKWIFCLTLVPFWFWFIIIPKSRFCAFGGLLSVCLDCLH